MNLIPGRQHRLKGRCIGRAYESRVYKESSRRRKIRRSRNWRSRQEPRCYAIVDCITHDTHQPGTKPGRGQRLGIAPGSGTGSDGFQGCQRHARPSPCHPPWTAGDSCACGTRPFRFSFFSFPSPSRYSPSHRHLLSLLRTRIQQCLRTLERASRWRTAAYCSCCWEEPVSSESEVSSSASSFSSCDGRRARHERSAFFGGEVVDSTGRLREIAAGL